MGGKRTRQQNATRKEAKEAADFAKSAGASRLGQGAAASQAASRSIDSMKKLFNDGEAWKKDYDAQMKKKRKTVGYWDAAKGERRGG